MKKVYGCIRLIRPINCFMMGLAVYVGICIVLRRFEYIPSHVIPPYITGFTLCGASMALNDYFDLPIDRINAPHRPIPSGAVTPRLALILSITLLGLGLSSSILTSPICFLYAVFFAIISYLYSWRIKRLGFLGNIMVSLCVSAPFVYGGLAALSIYNRGVDGSFILIILFSSIAFLANLGREITKGIADIEGDRSHGVKSPAVRYGERAASNLASILYILAVALSIIPPILGLVSVYYYPIIAFVDLGFIYSIVELRRSLSRETALKVKNTVLILMLMGIIGFMLGGLT
ncbi:MAG: geranylgeranylglycerol-phosphate geranylgeranyltransferase [Candidatus Bathyarchaeia archaeon]|nr:geranylgeranylglycerol-phosphate geranylgeranyltransferase [Candidatus Bathyarchaeota archaeon]